MALVRLRRPNGIETKLVVEDERLQEVMDRANREFGTDKDWNPYIEYEIRKSEWLRTHPKAKPEEITRAFTKIAEELGI